MENTDELYSTSLSKSTPTSRISSMHLNRTLSIEYQTATFISQNIKSSSSSNLWLNDSRTTNAITSDTSDEFAPTFIGGCFMIMTITFNLKDEIALRSNYNIKDTK